MKYSGLLAKAMKTDYRIERADSQFTVIDPDGETVDTSLSEDAARAEIECRKEEDRMWENPWAE